MSYIGKSPQVGAYNMLDALTASATASYSLTLDSVAFTPESANHLLVSLNGSIQKAGSSYTVSGSTLTFSSALTSSDSIDFVLALGNVLDIGTPSDGTVTPAKLNLNSGITVTTSDNSDNLTLVSTDTDANYGPNIEMSRPVTGATNDLLGRIDFSGQDAAGNAHNYASIEATIADATSGGEEGGFKIRSEVGGATKNMLDINGTELVINQDAADYDFRVETNSTTHMLYVDSTNDAVCIGNSNLAPSTSSTATHAVFKNGGSKLEISASNNTSLAVNRVNSEGTAVELRQAGGLRGSISVAGATAAFNTSSDYRLKENVSYDWDATSRLKQLKPARFNWISDETNTLVDGFLAHEAQTVVPESVIGEKDAVDENGDVDPQQIDHSKLVPLLVKTIQELEARITALESE